LGKDSIDPFLNYPEKGVFLLCKTSNSGSGDLQDVSVVGADGRPPLPLYEHVAHLAQSWNTKNNIGLVVGATHVDAMKRVRAAAPDLWFLTPGVGAQGGELEAALKAGLRADGKGMLIPISRGISRAENPKLAAAEIRDEILHIKREMNR
jgi:uridine monophosphate synthetase